MKSENVLISYDKEADVMYINFQDVKAEAEEIEDGVFARYNYKDKSLAGFTIMNFSKKFGKIPKEIKIPLHEEIVA